MRNLDVFVYIRYFNGNPIMHLIMLCMITKDWSPTKQMTYHLDLPHVSQGYTSQEELDKISGEKLFIVK